MGTIQTLKDTGSLNLITSSYDGAVYRLAGDDCVCEGIGDEFDLNYSASSLQVSFDAGSQCVICGNFFKVKAISEVTLPASSTIYLCARIDTSKTAGNTGSFEALTQAQITSGNINGNDSTRDLLLYVVTTNATGVTAIQDRRYIKGSGSGDATTGVLTAGQTTITLQDARIDSNSILSFYTSTFGVTPTACSVSTGSVTLTFESQASDLTVAVKVEGRY